MSLDGHLHTLQAKHAEMEATIIAEMARPLPDFIEITRLKKQKLALKQELERFTKTLQQRRLDAS